MLIFGQFEIDSLFHTSEAVSALEWYDHIGEHQWWAVPPRSVLTVTARDAEQQCVTVVQSTW